MQDMDEPLNTSLAETEGGILSDEMEAEVEESQEIEEVPSSEV